MITTFIIEMIAGLVQGLLALVPTWGVSTSALSGVNTAAAAAGSLDGWVPEQFVFLCLGIMLGARAWLLLWNAILWAYHMVPFNGGA